MPVHADRFSAHVGEMNYKFRNEEQRRAQAGFDKRAGIVGAEKCKAFA
jgi:hypothetical protein